MSGLNKMITDEWLTPPDLLSRLGSFDLDPCSPINRPWDTAKNHYNRADGDGLLMEWFGRVWCNPPYGRQTGNWLNKLASHGNGIALIFARTETRMFFEHVWNKADAVLFLMGRLFFYKIDGSKAANNACAPSVLIAYGEYNSKILSTLGDIGKFVQL